MNFLLLIFFACAPSLIWLFFFLQEEIHPEPKKLLAKTFFLGAIFSLIAGIAQKFSLDFLGNFEIAKYSIFSFIILAFIEEIVKFLAAYSSVKRNSFFTEPVEAMIYMMAAAMGFATAENILVILNGFLNNAVTWPEISNILILRFIGATLLHALSSSLVGYYWTKNKLSFGIIIASVLHSIFNFLIIIYNTSMVYPLIFLTIFAIFIFHDFELARKKTVIPAEAGV